MSSGGQQPVTQQTQQTRDPWAPAQPFLREAMETAQGNFQSNVGYLPWGGATQAPVDSLLQQGMGAGQNIANWDIGGAPETWAAKGLAKNMIDERGLSPELKSLYQQAQGAQNPYLQNILNTSNRQISDKIGSSMSGAGRYGSGQHTDVAARAMAEAADPVLAQDYARRQQQMQGIAEGGLQRAGQWAQLAPSLEEALYAPSQHMMALGQFNQERAQGLLDDQIKAWNAGQARPWEQLARYNAIAGGAGALGGSMTGSQTTPINSPSTLQKLFGGAAAGAGIGGSFGGPAGAGVGALGGGLLGLL